MEWGTLKFKKIQRKVNTIVKNINLQTECDELWRGRFYIYQTREHHRKWEDGSGISSYFCFRIVDKKTGVTKDVYGLSGSYFIMTKGYKLLEELNHFIVKDLDVWRKEEPYKDNTDYRKIKVIR